MVRLGKDLVGLCTFRLVLETLVSVFVSAAPCCSVEVTFASSSPCCSVPNLDSDFFAFAPEGLKSDKIGHFTSINSAKFEVDIEIQVKIRIKPRMLSCTHSTCASYM